MKNVIAILILFSCVAVQAQDIVVYFAKGNVMLVDGNSKLKAKPNTVLKSTTIVEIGNESMVVLMQQEKAIVIKEAGKQSFEEIEKLFSATKKSVSDKYIAYLWKTAQEQENSNDDLGDGKLGVTGMVSRGEGGIIAPPDSSIVISKSFSIQVEEAMVPGTLFFYEKKRPSFSISFSSAEIELGNRGLMDNRSWFGIAVSTEDNAPTSGIIYLRWATETERQSATQELQNLMVEISGYPQEVQDDIIHAFFQKNHFVTQQSN